MNSFSHMIVDLVANIERKVPHSGLMDKAIALAKELVGKNLDDLKTGRYEVDGDRLFYMIQRYNTKTPEEAKFESHEEYIDLQVILAGREIIGYAPVAQLEETGRPKKDFIEYADPASFTPVHMEAGMCAIFYPGDGHKPCYSIGEQQEVVKLVIKVKASEVLATQKKPVMK